MRLARLVNNTEYFDKYFSILLNDNILDVSILRYKIKDEHKTDIFYHLSDDIFNDDSQVEFYIENTNDPILYYLWYYKIDNISFCEKCQAPYIKSKKQTTGMGLCKHCQEENHLHMSRRCMRRLRKNVDDQGD